MNDLTPSEAVDRLQQVLEQQSNIVAQNAEKIRLDSALLAEQQRANDLKAHEQELQQRAENRRESNINELIRRLLDEREELKRVVGVLEKAISKAASLDNGMGDLIDIILDNQQSLLQAMHTLLSRNNASAQADEVVIGLRYQLTTHVKNLQNLKIRAARHGMDVPTGLQNEIELEELEIAKIREVLSNQ